MRDVANSMLSFSWAMSLFGVRQMENLLPPAGRPWTAADADAAFYSVTIATQDQLGNVLRGAFQAGDELQRGMTDFVYNLITLEAFDCNNPNNLLQVTGDLAQQSEETLRIWLTGRDGVIAWRELQNKLKVFDLVKDVRHSLKITSETEIPLLETVERAYAAGDYSALWLVEGLGHDYADTFWARGETPRGILSLRSLPGKSLTMLHAGLGLSFAQRLLHELTPQSSANEIRRVLTQFINLCDQNSRSGYTGAAYESLGLVARTIFPQIVQVIDKELRQMSREVRGYFWHGVGRALYFTALYFVPGLFSPWRAAVREAPDEFARRSSLSGLTWAIVEVNITDPEVMESTLRNQPEMVAEDAFANGVGSGIIMRYDTTPNARFTEAWCQHEPASGDRDLVNSWNENVRRPCRAALEQYYGVLKGNHRLGEVFRYQSLPALVARLEHRHY